MTDRRAGGVRAALDTTLRDFQHPTPVELILEVGTRGADNLVWVLTADGSRAGFWVEHT